MGDVRVSLPLIKNHGGEAMNQAYAPPYGHEYEIQPISLFQDSNKCCTYL